MQQAESGLAAVASRREAISAAGLAIAGAAGPWPAPRNRIIFGATLGAYPELNAAVPRAMGLRMYFDGENEFPSAWPDPHPTPPETRSVTRPMSTTHVPPSECSTTGTGYAGELGSGSA